MSASTGSEEISGAAKGVVIVAVVSAVSLLVLVLIIAWKVVKAILSYLPQSQPTAKPRGKGKGKGSAAADVAAASEPVETKARGPDLKSLIKEQQKTKNIKSTPKDEQASHHHLFLNTLKGHGDAVQGMAWNADGTQLATACEDMVVRLWDLLDVTSKEPRHRRIRTAKPPLGVSWGDSADTAVVLMRGAPDALVGGYGPAASTGSKDSGAGFEEKWLVTHVHGKGVPLMMRGAAGGQGRRAVAVSLSDTKEAKVFNAQGREIATLEPNSLRNHDLAVSPDGRFVAVASFTAEVKIWELKWAKDTGEFKGAVKAMELKGHKSQVMCVAFSPDSKRCVTASKDGTLRVWNIDVRYHLEEDPKTLLVIPPPLAQGRLYQRLAYGPGGVISGSWEGTIQLLSATNGELLEVIDAHDGPVTMMSWCPRLVKTPGASAPHAVLATSSKDRRVRLWRAP